MRLLEAEWISTKLGNTPSSAFIWGNRLDIRLRDVPLAEGDVNMISQIFWKKNEGDTVPDNLSSSSNTL